MSTIKPLHLSLKVKWFDMIGSGEKRFEYRAITPYFCQKFLLCLGEVKSQSYWHKILKNFEKDNIEPHDAIKNLIDFEIFSFRPYSKLILSKGYSKDRDQMTFEYRPPVFSTGRMTWGAKPGVFYFCLLLTRK